MPIKKKKKTWIQFIQQALFFSGGIRREKVERKWETPLSRSDVKQNGFACFISERGGEWQALENDITF